MRPKSLVLLALALGCGLVASIGISQVMENRKSQAPSAVESEPVLVALRDIDRTEMLTPENVALKDFPKDSIPEGAVREFTEIDGLRPSTRLIAGEIILAGKVGSNEKATKSIPAGYRAVTVKVDATTGGAGLLVPGDRVDVQVFARKNPSAGVMESGTWTFLQDVSVFAVNSAITTDPDNPDQTMEAKTITLLVTPAQAAKVTLAAEVGRIRLIPRGAFDDTSAEESQATWDELTSDSDKLDGKEGADPKPASEPLQHIADDPSQGVTKQMIADFQEQQKQLLAAQQAQQLAALPEQAFEMVIHDGSNIRVMQFREGDNLPIDVTGSSRTNNFGIPAHGNDAAANGHNSLPPVRLPSADGGDFDPDADFVHVGDDDADPNSADDGTTDEPMNDDVPSE